MDNSGVDVQAQTIIEGNVDIEHGDFIGRDKSIQGDEIDGDKILGNKIVNFFGTVKSSRTRIILTIDGDFSSFSEKDQMHLQRIIAEALHMSEPVDIHKIERGSIKVTLELPSEKADELYKIVKSGNLKQHHIVDVELVNRLKKGDTQAWLDLIDQYGNSIYNYLLWNLDNEDAAQEKLTICLKKAVQHIAKFDGEMELVTFLYSLAHREVVDYWRTSVASFKPLSPGETELDEALKNLDAELRSILFMRYGVGLTVSQLAKVLAKSSSATELLLNQARSKLKELIK